MLCLYFVYKAELLKVLNHSIAQNGKSFSKSQKGWATIRSLYDEAKYANYPADELRMEFYLRMMRTPTTKRRFRIFNVFGGSKPVFTAMVSKNPKGTIYLV